MWGKELNCIGWNVVFYIGGDRSRERPYLYEKRPEWEKLA